MDRFLQRVWKESAPNRSYASALLHVRRVIRTVGIGPCSLVETGPMNWLCNFNDQDYTICSCPQMIVPSACERACQVLNRRMIQPRGVPRRLSSDCANLFPKNAGRAIPSSSKYLRGRPACPLANDTWPRARTEHTPQFKYNWREVVTVGFFRQLAAAPDVVSRFPYTTGRSLLR